MYCVTIKQVTGNSRHTLGVWYIAAQYFLHFAGKEVTIDQRNAIADCFSVNGECAIFCLDEIEADFICRRMEQVAAVSEAGKFTIRQAALSVDCGGV